MAKEKRAAWFKMFRHTRAAIEVISDEDAGRAIKEALRYFDGDEVDTDSMTPQSVIAFSLFRVSIDEANRDYEEAAENGRKGAEKRHNARKQTGTHHDDSLGSLSPPKGTYRDPKPPLAPLREAEAEADANIEERSAANIIINNKAAAEFSEIPDEDLTDEQVLEKYADVPYDQKPLSWYNARKRVCFNQMEQIK